MKQIVIALSLVFLGMGICLALGVATGIFPALAAMRLRVADAVRQVTSDHSAPELRLRATLALVIFTDIDGKAITLGSLALDRA